MAQSHSMVLQTPRETLWDLNDYGSAALMQLATFIPLPRNTYNIQFGDVAAPATTLSVTCNTTRDAQFLHQYLATYNLQAGLIALAQLKDAEQAVSDHAAATTLTNFNNESVVDLIGSQLPKLADDEDEMTCSQVYSNYFK
jgi:hypothetical protein